MSGPKYTEADLAKVLALPEAQYSLKDVERLTGVTASTVGRMRRGEWRPPSDPSMPLLGRSPLTGVIEDYMEDDGCTLDGLTVLARGNDPFRQDTAEGHRLGRWLRDTLEASWASRSARAAGPSTTGACTTCSSGRSSRTARCTPTPSASRSG